MRIAEAAFKRPIEAEDMLHAVQYAIRVQPEDENFTMVTGPARDGTLLEIGILGFNALDSDDQDDTQAAEVEQATEPEFPVIIHAMPARNQFLPGHKEKR